MYVCVVTLILGNIPLIRYKMIWSVQIVKQHISYNCGYTAKSLKLLFFADTSKIIHDVKLFSDFLR